MKDKHYSLQEKLTINCRGKLVSLKNPLVMGILNITPDSFFDGGKYQHERTWLNQAEKMMNEGADIIDIGAVSTRPGSPGISVKEELKTILNTLNSIRKHFPEMILSIDTWRSDVADKAIENGVDIINDISGGTMDENMFATIARYNIPYILMHIQGTPQTMQNIPVYQNVANELILFFSQQIQKLRLLGVNDIMIDPGFGFGKTIAHNFEILNKLDLFTLFELPILVGLSRKSMIWKTLNISAADALNGTTAVNTIALMKGANILRVHDVKHAVESVKLFNQYNG